ncbi:hypothetical protein MKW92_035528, partial [Papaver armeniacum]
MQPPLPPGGAPPPPPSQFSSAPPAPHVVQHGGSMYYHGPPFPPRLAPLPSSHGQMLYSTATQLPLPSSYVHSSYENPFETVFSTDKLTTTTTTRAYFKCFGLFGQIFEDGNRCVKGATGKTR